MSDRYSMETLKTRARRRTKGYDAYDGVWDRPIWLRVRIKEHVETLLSISFKIGDIALARYGRDIPGTPSNVANVLFAYSLRSGSDMSISNFDILEGPK